MKNLIVLIIFVTLVSCVSNKAVTHDNSYSLETASFEELDATQVAEYNKIQVIKDSASVVVRKDNQ